MHTYRSFAKDDGSAPEWRVGYWLVQQYEEPTQVWTTLSTHRDEIAAIRRVNFLNGGTTVNTGDL